MNNKIMLVGGGTGGHVTPLLAVAEELLAQGAQPQNIYLITDRDSAKKDYLQGHRINLLTISGGKLSRFIAVANLFAPFLIFWGFIQSIYLILRIWPDVIFAKGAYLSFPFVIAAWILQKKVYLHESDSIMGLTNRRLLFTAEKLFVSFPVGTYPSEVQKKLEYSGLPIRKGFLDIYLGDLKSEKIMIMGGSQGADRINYYISMRLKDYLKKYELFHICGENHFAKYDKIRSHLSINLQKRYHLYGFVGAEIEKIMASADLIISRSSSSIFEFAVLKRPAVLIPYPFAASNHQLRNAEIFEMAGSAKVLHESKIDENILYKEINKLMKSKSARKQLAKNISKFACKDAAKTIVNELLNG